MNMQNKEKKRHAPALSVWEMVVFAMLGTVMFCSKIIMEALPNIHLLGALTMAYTVAFRKKALIPIYIYVVLNGVYSGFSAWWVPYTYIWTILWIVVMLLPRRLPRWAKAIIYPAICGVHGFAFGTLYAPAQAIMFHLDFRGMLAWIGAGLPFDLIHGVGNSLAGLLVLPLGEVLTRLAKSARKR